MQSSAVRKRRGTSNLRKDTSPCHEGSGRPEVFWTHPFLPELLKSIPLDAQTLLDIGCGRGLVGALFSIYRARRFSVGVDAWPPYLEEARKYYDRVIECDLRFMWPPLPEAKFDVGCFIEAIEHFPKERGNRLLKLLEDHCKRVIVSTPRRFYGQDAYDKNPRQRHVSGWTLKEFKKMGYSKIIRDPIPFRGYYLRSLSWRILPELFRSDTILVYKDIQAAPQIND